ncbi:unnamed protein product [Didymodactylos carnosus]|uniref:Uncharacterized protein n=1 Tax=Didymodactylos carnosus TaxID=1234261 RepID=A0A8S2E733_9BILA|nr:unnamed protein product [Didymodactylos carnosus]CAF3870707.1 unnamed protein product [Didymodactylos carnosus]
MVLKVTTKAYHYSKKYIEKILNEYKDVDTAKHNQSKWTKKPCICGWCFSDRYYANCVRGQKCTFKHCEPWSHDENNNDQWIVKSKPTKYKLYQCNVSTKHNQRCSFYVCGCHHIHHGRFNDLLYIVSSRPSYTPVIVINPIEHMTNERFCKNKNTWYVIEQTIMHVQQELKMNQYPLQGIYINFRQWMYKEDGHAHINLHLNQHAIDKCNQIPGIFPSLVNCNEPPKNYRLQDINNLEVVIASTVPAIVSKISWIGHRNVMQLENDEEEDRQNIYVEQLLTKNYQVLFVLININDLRFG